MEAASFRLVPRGQTATGVRVLKLAIEWPAFVDAVRPLSTEWSVPQGLTLIGLK